MTILDLLEAFTVEELEQLRRDIQLCRVSPVFCVEPLVVEDEGD